MRTWILSTAAVGLFAISGAASAASCPASDPFIASPCTTYFDGVGANEDLAQILGNYPDVMYFDKDENAGQAPAPMAGWTEADFNLGDADFGASTSGSFFISSALLDAYSQFVLILKGGSGDPRWRMFDLDMTALRNNGGEGTWSTTQGLSHATLYVGGPRQVPEPTSLALLGLGLAGLSFARRLRTK